MICSDRGPSIVSADVRSSTYHPLNTSGIVRAMICLLCPKSLDCPEASLLCLIFEALARTTLALETPDSSVKAEELCLRLTTALDRPGGTAQHSSAGTKSVGGKGAGNSKGTIKLKGSGSVWPPVICTTLRFVSGLVTLTTLSIRPSNGHR